MFTMRDNLGRFEIVAETEFARVSVEWINYIENNILIKAAGGRFVTQVREKTTGEVLVRRHAKNEMIRDRMLCTSIAQAEEILDKRVEEKLNV